MKIIISGGGTGGHIYPALAIAEELRKMSQETDIIYVGTEGSLEQELSEKAGYDFRAIRVKGMPRKLDKRSFIAAWNLILGILDSRKLLKLEKPDLVVGTGGYVSGPVAFVAGLMKIPVVIHEQNAFPGLTNKLLSRVADKVLITYPDSAKYFKHPERTVVTGNPIRKDIKSMDRDTAIYEMGINPDKKFILSFGGSGGQKSLNRSIMEIIEDGQLPEEVILMHITGSRHFESFMKELSEKGITLPENIEIVEYCHKMPVALNAADMVITSGGAITLAELSAVGLPSILIPKAYTAENHQEYNARAVEKSGAAVVILERDINGRVLLEEVNKLLIDGELLCQMSVNSSKLGNPDASKAMIKELGQWINPT